MNKYLLFLCFISIGSAVIAQDISQKRFEIPLSDEDFNSTENTIINAEENGLFLINKIESKTSSRVESWGLLHLDTALNIAWQDTLHFDDKYVLLGYDYSGGFLYFLYKHVSRQKDFMVERVDVNSSEKENFKIEFDFFLYLTEFEVINESVVIGGYVNNVPTFVCFNFNDPKPRVLSGLYNNTDKILQVEMQNDKGVFNIITNYRMRDKKTSISFKSYSAEGELISNVDLKPQGEYGLLYGRSIAVDKFFQIIAGTYTYKVSDMSRGVFIASVDGSGDHILNYYNFADLKNFFNYMKAKKELRVKERIERRKVKGKKNKFNYKLLVHDIIEQDDQYIMIGEAFYPKYNSSGSGYFLPSNGSYDRNSLFFDGYVYTHAVVIGINKEGKIIWDNSFEIEDVITPSLEQYVHVAPTSDETNLLYLYEGVIRSKLIRGGEVLDGRSYNKLTLTLDNDEIVDYEDDESKMMDWYDNHYFAYGKQKIQNVNEYGTPNVRKVFFINKISYQ